MPQSSISLETLSQYFHLPITEVARKLGVCATVLKKICRRYDEVSDTKRNGIPRWPHRKIKSLDKMISNLRIALSKNPEDAERLEQEIRNIQARKDFLVKNPNVLTAERKAAYKYKTGFDGKRKSHRDGSADASDNDDMILDVPLRHSPRRVVGGPAFSTRRRSISSTMASFSTAQELPGGELAGEEEKSSSLPRWSSADLDADDDEDDDDDDEDDDDEDFDAGFVQTSGLSSQALAALPPSSSVGSSGESILASKSDEVVVREEDMMDVSSPGSSHSVSATTFGGKRRTPAIGTMDQTLLDVPSEATAEFPKPIKRPRGKSLAVTSRPNLAARRAERIKVRESQALAPSWKKQSRSQHQYQQVSEKDLSDDEMAEEGAQVMTEIRRALAQQYFQQRQQAYATAWWHQHQQQQMAIQFLRRHSLPASVPLASMTTEGPVVYYIPNPSISSTGSDIRHATYTRRPSTAAAQSIAPSDHSAFSSVSQTETEQATNPQKPSDSLMQVKQEPEKSSDASVPSASVSQSTEKPTASVDATRTATRLTAPELQFAPASTAASATAPTHYYYPAIAIGSPQMMQQRWLAYQNYLMQRQAYYPQYMAAWPTATSGSPMQHAASTTQAVVPNYIQSYPLSSHMSTHVRQQPNLSAQQGAPAIPPPLVWHSTYTPNVPPPGFKCSDRSPRDDMSVDQSSSQDMSADTDGANAAVAVPASPVAAEEYNGPTMQ